MKTEILGAFSAETRHFYPAFASLPSISMAGKTADRSAPQSLRGGQLA
ncbi:MAG: hypothetical protein PHQ12_04835 [Chthoniobacteraceae bacterium]|nr:hypothetical protein [Chthoniobacteraceae bacterium]